MIEALRVVMPNEQISTELDHEDEDREVIRVALWTVRETTATTRTITGHTKVRAWEIVHWVYCPGEPWEGDSIEPTDRTEVHRHSLSVVARVAGLLAEGRAMARLEGHYNV